jgi:hypothetical protein
MVQRATDDISFGVSDVRMPRGRHVCYLFGDEDERFRTLARYYRAGAEDGDKLSYVTDGLSSEDLRARLAARGADLGLARRVIVRRAAEVFHPEGRFVPEATIDRFAGACLDALGEGFGGLRGSAEMSWATRGVPGSERMLEYEVLLNSLYEGGDGPPLFCVCQYDTRLFDGETIQALVEIHPYLLVEGQILWNPNHVSSEEMMRRLRAAAA